MYICSLNSLVYKILFHACNKQFGNSASQSMLRAWSIVRQSSNSAFYFFLEHTKDQFNVLFSWLLLCYAYYFVWWNSLSNLYFSSLGTGKETEDSMLLQQLSDACLVVDALEPSVREELVKNFCSKELTSYRQIFEGAGLALYMLRISPVVILVPIYLLP